MEPEQAAQERQEGAKLEPQPRGLDGGGRGFAPQTPGLKPETRTLNSKPQPQTPNAKPKIRTRRPKAEIQNTKFGIVKHRKQAYFIDLI